MNDKQEITTACDLAETADVGVVFTYNPDLEKSELPISKFKICQLKMCAAIAEELSRQCQVSPRNKRKWVPLSKRRTWYVMQ